MRTKGITATLLAMAILVLPSCDDKGDAVAPPLAGGVARVAPETPDVVKYGRYIVFTVGTPQANRAARGAVEHRGGEVVKDFMWGRGIVAIIADHALDAISRAPGVRAVEPDVLLRAIQRGKKPRKNDPPQPAQTLPWGIDRIDAELVTAALVSVLPGVKVAIIDTGIDKEHLDLAIAGGVNFIGKGPSNKNPKADKWDDDNGHGTHVAGTVAAVDNSIGVVGAAPGVSLYAVKVLDRNGSGNLSTVIDGILWTIDNGMDVINMSLGIAKETLDQYPNTRQALQDAVDAARDAGIVVVCAAGNSGGGTDTVGYPARFASAIAVAAVDGANVRATFSSTGPSVEISAPGVGILSTWSDGLYNTISGTSMASPHVAGVAALVITAGVTDSNGNGRTNDEVRSVLQTTATPLGTQTQYGHGLVQADAAIQR